MKPINILCDAVPFCFGPISKIISVAEHLYSNNAKLTLLAFGTSKELGTKSKLFNIVDCNSENPQDLENHKSLFNEADVFITSMNTTATEFALNLGKPVIYIDSLFWMWDSIPETFAKIDKYFVQNFFNSKESLGKYPFLKNVEFVGPIIDDSQPIQNTKEDFVLVNFGGMESALIQIGKNSNYPFIIGKIIIDELEKSGQEAFICGNDKVLQKLLHDKPKNVHIGGKSHKEFLELLRKTKLLITTPGLTTSFEAFHYGAPTVFLPPENYSQFLNLKEFRKQKVAQYSFHWMDIYPNLNLVAGEDETAGVCKVLEAIKKFETDTESKHKLEQFINTILSTQEFDADNQQEYLNSLGKNSSKYIADYILTAYNGGVVK
ncbi:MAG: hypothetical protein WCW13_05395 [archaeon]|jgi:hypothetical protein